MRPVGTLVEVCLKTNAEQQFLVATRILRMQCRSNPGLLRFELLQRGANDFVLHLTFRDTWARSSHDEAAHTRIWTEALDSLADAVVSRQVAAVLSEPVPPLLPRGRRPILESATGLHSARPLPDVLAPARTETPAMPTRQPRVEIFLERMELAVARDAFLRGAPEPCLLAACYQLDSEQAVALGRAIYRVKFEGQSPCELKFGKRLLDLPVRADTFPARLCLLVCAIEENGGRDVQFVYRQLGAPEQLFLWKTTDREPEVQRLIDADRVVSVNRAASVNLLCDGSPLADSFSDDTWVGAACALVEFPAPDEERELNFDTSSEDSRNDWTSVWSLRFA